MRYVLVAVAALLLGIFAAGNTDVLTETFFPEENLVARITLNGGSNEKDTEEGKASAEEGTDLKVKSCSFGGSSMSPVSPMGPIVINEIAWMGDEESFSNEWIELKNIGPISPINISGWQVLDKDEQIKVILSGEIDSGKFLVLRRGTDYEGNLRNSDEGLRLFGKGCNLVDEAVANPAWPAGDNKNKLTMERAADFSWYTASVAGGTPNKENSISPINPISPISPIDPIDSAAQAAEAAGKININTAGYEELQEITGVGPKIAQRIIDYRNANGPFGKIEDLIKVSGIGEVTFQKMRDEISI